MDGFTYSFSAKVTITVSVINLVETKGHMDGSTITLCTKGGLIDVEELRREEASGDLEEPVGTVGSRSPRDKGFGQQDSI
jgi:hypothetical protein